jgi:hypothetical protein
MSYLRRKAYWANQFAQSVRKPEALHCDCCGSTDEVQVIDGAPCCYECEIGQCPARREECLDA